MSDAKTGDTVQVHYTRSLANGSELASSHGRDPLQFTLTQGSMIVGCEPAVLDMRPGERKRITIPREQAYG